MKKKNQKIIAGCIVGALLIAGVGALGGASKGFKDWDTKNWKQNLEDVFKKDDVDDGTKTQVASLDVDKADTSKVYVIPSGTLNFGNSGSEEAINQVVQTEAIEDSKAGKIGIMSMAKGNELHTMANTTSSTQFIQLTASVNPTGATKDLTSVEWTITGIDNLSDYLEIQYPNGSDTPQNKLTIKLVVKKAFTQVGMLKVVVKNNEIQASDTCNLNYYKQYNGFDLAWDGDMTDSKLASGERISYTITEKYGDGTIDQLNLTDFSVGYESIIDGLTINYDFMKNEVASAYNSSALGQAFDYDVFYGSADYFSGVASVMTGAGRNAVNNKLAASSKDVKMTIEKAGFSKYLLFDVDAEGVTYPESVQIGDGSDVQIGKN